MAHIKLHHSLSRAHKVLARANAIGFSKAAGRRFEVYSWDNCREQGVVLKALLLVRNPGPQESPFKSPGVFIAECRNSDETVIVVDKDMGPHIVSMPTVRAWEKGRHYFRYNDINGAAKFVVETVNALAAKYLEDRP
jgi:hypothetical protein